MPLAAVALRIRSATLAPIALAVTSLACRSPTQITVEMTTDVPCGSQQGASLTVGVPEQLENKPVTSTAVACDPTTGRIGSVVIVPSGSDSDDVGIKVVLGLDRSAALCVPPYGQGCVVARRSLRFIPHTTLVVPIHLEQACDGIACDPSTTCVHGQCLPAAIPDPTVCEGAGGCPEGTLYPDAGGPDATLVDGGPVTAACGDMGGLAPGAAWPTTAYCPTRIGRSPLVGPQTSALKWSIPVTGTFAVSIAADGTIYFVDLDVLTALAPDGGVLWAASSAPSIALQTPTLGSDGNIYVGGAYDSNLYVFSPDGGLARTFTTGIDAGQTSIDLRGASGELYFRTFNGGGDTYVGVYDVGAQHLVYSVVLPGTAEGALGVGPGGIVYEASGDGLFRALAPTTGATTWSYDSGLAATGSVSGGVLASDHVSFTTYSGLSELALDGGIAWTATTLNTSGTAGPGVAADGTLYVGTSSGMVVAVNPASGATVWSTTIATSANPYVVSTPVVDALGTIYVGTDYDGVHALRPDGGEAWSFDAGGLVRDYLTLGNGVLIFTAQAADGGLQLMAVGP